MKFYQNFTSYVLRRDIICNKLPMVPPCQIEWDVVDQTASFHYSPCLDYNACYAATCPANSNWKIFLNKDNHIWHTTLQSLNAWRMVSSTHAQSTQKGWQMCLWESICLGFRPFLIRYCIICYLILPMSHNEWSIWNKIIFQNKWSISISNAYF